MNNRRKNIHTHLFEEDSFQSASVGIVGVDLIDDLIELLAGTPPVVGNHVLVEFHRSQERRPQLRGVEEYLKIIAKISSRIVKIFEKEPTTVPCFSVFSRCLIGFG